MSALVFCERWICVSIDIFVEVPYAHPPVVLHANAERQDNILRYVRLVRHCRQSKLGGKDETGNGRRADANVGNGRAATYDHTCIGAGWRVTPVEIFDFELRRV